MGRRITRPTRDFGRRADGGDELAAGGRRGCDFDRGGVLHFDLCGLCVRRCWLGGIGQFARLGGGAGFGDLDRLLTLGGCNSAGLGSTLGAELGGIGWRGRAVAGAGTIAPVSPTASGVGGSGQEERCQDGWR